MAIQPVSLAQHVREGVIAAINALNEVIGIANEQKKSYIEYSSLGSVAANSHVDFTVTFPTGLFTTQPIVIANLYSSSTNAAFGNVSVSILNVTETGFTARVFNASSTPFTPGLNYFARERG